MVHSERRSSTIVRVAFLILMAPLVACSADASSRSEVGTAPASSTTSSALVAAGPRKAEKAALVDPDVISTLRSVAIRASTKAGVPQPRSVYAVAASDHQAAETLLSGAVINDHSPVFVIVMTGGPFTRTSHPPGAKPPTGNVMRLTVDAQSYRVTDIGLISDAPDLSQIDSNVVDLTAE
jgi:hypothetical protein